MTVDGFVDTPQLDFDRKKEFDYVDPREAISRMDVRVFTLSDGIDKQTGLVTRIIEFPDLDGKPRLIPNFYEPGQSLDIVPILETNARSVKDDKLDNRMLEVLKYGLNDLKLPTMLAVEGLNLGPNPWEDFVVPEKEVESSSLITVLGYAGSGKSTILAALGLRVGIPIGSLDQFSGKSPNAYLGYFLEKGLHSGSSSEEIIKAVYEFNVEVGARKKARVEKQIAKPLSKTLNELTQDLKGGKRPPAILVEGVAVKSLGDERTMNIYDLVSEQASEGFFLAESRLINGTEMSSENLDEIIGGFKTNISHIAKMSRIVRQTFVDSLR